MSGNTQFWFTSDTHWFHDRIIEYCNRPFLNCNVMDLELIDRWNAVVKTGDLVYHLGDFAITWNKNESERIELLASKLHGSIHLIYGNHDREAVKRAKCFAWQGEYKRVTIDGQSIVLCHYPILSWHGMHRGAWHLHGHCHGSLTPNVQAKRLDVGVDCWEFRPISLETVRQEMEKRSFMPVDHHAEM